MTATPRAPVALLAITLALAACGRPARPPIATLTEATGTVEAARAGGDDWAAIAPAIELGLDDAARTGARSSARFSLVGGGAIRMSENSRLRFRRGVAADGGGVEMNLDLGRAEMEDASSFVVVTAGGRARIDRGSRVRISASGTMGSIEVIVGRAMLLPLSGPDAGSGRAAQPASIGAGQGVTLRIGTAVVEWFSVRVGDAVIEPEAPVASAAPAPRDGSPPPERAATRTVGAPLHAGDTRDRDTPPEVSDARLADVTVTAGESVVLHDGAPPLLVRVRFDQVCPGGASVEIGRRGRALRRLSGAAAVVARLAAGDHPYRVRCLSDADNREQRATGVVTVKRDSGNVPLARRAPTNLIEADGRRYTVLFQTRLPALTLVWPTHAAARAGADFEVRVQSASGTRVFHTAQPSLRLPAGALAEGEHSWWFASPEGRSSPKTTVLICFDNTAPTAQFFRAATPAAAPPGAIPVDGVTVKGAKVSIAGKALAVDEHGRFQDTVAPSAGDDAVAVRVEMPHGEAHYYVKRRLLAR